LGLKTVESIRWTARNTDDPDKQFSCLVFTIVNVLAQGLPAPQPGGSQWPDDGPPVVLPEFPDELPEMEVDVDVEDNFWKRAL
jgi:hypothetical protein